ncbi:MAG: WXG100 family type VII secretion target [Clostridia bacterium]|nr:WXG100 family type VII secretion target [Clostridia bacterium]
MARFRINYSKVIRQADDIEELSRDLNREIGRLENLLSQIKREWCGPASEAFQNQLTMLIADMKATKHGMSNVSGTIKDVASRIQDEDERLAMQMAQR